MSLYSILTEAIFGVPNSFAADTIILTLVAIVFMSILDGIFDTITTLIKKV